MTLLKITDREYAQLDELFEDIDTVGLDRLSPEVIDGKTDVKVNGTPITAYDGVFCEIPEKNVVFGRILLDLIEKQGVPVNYPSTAFFIMAKKNYLYHVLHEKDINAPTTVIAASERGARGIEQDLEFPVVGRRFEDNEATQTKLLETEENLAEFADGTEYENTLLLFHEYTEGEKYRCLVTDDRIISLQDESDSVWVGEKNLKYSTLSDDQRSVAQGARRGIGTPICEVLLIGETVYDVNPNPDLELYTDISGKSAYSIIPAILAGDVE